MDIDLLDEPLGQDADGEDVYLKDIWPSAADVASTVESAVRSDMFTSSYSEVFEGDERWNSLEVPEGDRFEWGDSTYVRQPPFFEDLQPRRAISTRTASKTRTSTPTAPAAATTR
jgi:aconitate hydratase